MISKNVQGSFWKKAPLKNPLNAYLPNSAVNGGDGCFYFFFHCDSNMPPNISAQPSHARGESISP